MTKQTIIVQLRLVSLFSVTLAIAAFPTLVTAQVGANAVYNSTPAVTYSTSFFDATLFGSGDVCARINAALTSLASSYPSGVVIDARGLYSSPQVCSTNPFPSSSIPSTVLLPATIIEISAPWTIPSNTRVIGTGRYTQIRFNSSSGTDMIDMGTSSGCTGVSVEHLRVDANDVAVNGIVNYCGDSSYVGDVNFANFGTPTSSNPTVTAMTVSSTAAGSGPYTNINFSTGDVCNSSGACPACVSIQAPTRGLRGITCSAQDTRTNQAAIYVSASNNSIEDVHVENFWDGVQVVQSGALPAVSNVVVSNVLAVNNIGQTITTKNVVHICGPNPASGYAACGSTTSASDVTVLGVTYGYAQGNIPYTVNTIQDDVEATTVGVPGTTSSVLGLYALGEPYFVTGTLNGAPRLTTAPGAEVTTGSVPTWAAGTSAPPSSCSSSGSPLNGALYSYASGTYSNNNTIFICVGGVWHGIKM